MKASRLRVSASFLVGALGLLASLLSGGCGPYRDYVRRGQLLDSIADRTDRIDAAQQRLADDLRQLQAEELTRLEAIDAQLEQCDARLQDQADRTDRIGRRLGVWRGDLTPPVIDSLPVPDSAGRLPDSLPLGSDPDRLYNTAYLDFTRSKFQVAITGFRQYLSGFPDTELADNARYWIGECYYSLNELDSAEAAFKHVIADYPAGNKVPAAAYKLGILYLAAGRNDDARRQFKQVIDKYPNTPEAKLASARLDAER